MSSKSVTRDDRSRSRVSTDFATRSNLHICLNNRSNAMKALRSLAVTVDLLQLSMDEIPRPLCYV